MAMSIAAILVIIGLVLIILELIVGIETGFDLVILGAILVIGGFLGHYLANNQLAIILSVVLSMLYIFVGRSLVKQKLVVLTKHTNIDKLIGSRGVVVRSITPDTAGMVRVGDEDWRASAEQVLYEKDRVEVTSLEGVTLNVRKSS